MVPKQSQIVPKMVTKWSQNGPRMVQKCSKRVPKWSQNSSKRFPRWSQNGHKMVPKWSKNTPKWSQNSPKMVPKQYHYLPFQSSFLAKNKLYPPALTSIEFLLKTPLRKMALAPLFVNQFSIFFKILKPETHIYLQNIIKQYVNILFY